MSWQQVETRHRSVRKPDKNTARLIASLPDSRIPRVMMTQQCGSNSVGIVANGDAYVRNAPSM